MHLPVSEKGFPIPWFVAWLDDNGRVRPRGIGKPDFRVIMPGAVEQAAKLSLCWICGNKITAEKMTFVIGPMCAVTRISAEPPSHKICAKYAILACPFLVNPRTRRNEKDTPEGAYDVGTAIRRNPGVMLLWTCKTARMFPVDNGHLFEIGDPIQVSYYREGRHATRAEIMASIESGIPILREETEKQGLSLADLEQAIKSAKQYIPKAA